MLPGYITLFKDDDGFVHLFFYKGLTNENTYYYNDLDLSGIEKAGYTYTVNKFNDFTTDYIFDNKNIKSMNCNLISFNNKHFTQTLKIK